jgi:penicillin-binding protein 2
VLWEHFLLRKEEAFQRRIKVLGILVLVALGIVALRLGYLQVWQGHRFTELSARNRVRLVPIKAQRGLIYDRRGELLVGNVPAFNASLIPAAMWADPAARRREAELLQQLLGLSADELEDKLARRRYRAFEPLRLKGNLDRVAASLIEEHRPELPGVMVLTESQRYYKYGSLASHALGYVGEISEHELALREGYQSGDIVGQAGMERAYDRYLKGRNGWLQIEVDALGRQLGILGREDPWPGHALVLTLDRNLQAAAESILGTRPGTVLMEDVRTGEILAMASYPTYDPNRFARGIPQEEWDRLRSDRSYPLTNRATMGIYPPGSLFKIVMLTGGLQDHITDPYQTFECRGKFSIGEWDYRCWNLSGHGNVAAVRSLCESCDIYYYHLGLKMKVNRLGQWAYNFGYGQRTGVDLPTELPGLVPSPTWKERTQNMPWFPGNTVMFSIGQGYFLATPLQMLDMFCAAANRGTVYRPHLMRQVVSSTGRLIHSLQPEVAYKVEAAPEVWDVVQKGLVEVVNGRRGTGSAARLPGIKVAGKTATAQNPHGEDHAAFGAYAPAEAPQVAVLIYLENAGGGGAEAAPLARQMLEAYFDGSTGKVVEAH